MEQYSVYLKKFKIAAAILAIAILIFILLIVKNVPLIQNIASLQTEYKNQSTTLADSERKLSDLKTSAERKKEEDANIVKAFFNPSDLSLDSEAVISDEFGEIIQVLRENKIKTRTVKYDYDPQDDSFVKNVGNRYSVCRIDIEVVAKYDEFQNFLRELYKHKHFLDISKMEIVPYSKNKRILLINMQIKLYAVKDPSKSPAPQAVENGTSPQEAPAGTPPSGAPAEAPAPNSGGAEF